MASNNERLKALRAEVKRLETNTARKISRQRREKGVELAGTKFDPRTGKDVDRMRSRDLEAYARRLSGFTSRRTQFEAGDRGTPLPRSKWLEYKASETAVRDKFQKEMEPVKDKRLPGPPSSTETVGQRQEKIRAKHPTAMNMAYVPPERQPFNVKDLDALIKLTKNNKKRLTAKWDREEYKRAQKELRQMVEIFNDPNLIKSVEGLSKGQFNVLWNFTKFADNISLPYHAMKAKYDAKQEVPEETLRDQLNEAQSFIDWVKKMKI